MSKQKVKSNEWHQHQ